MSTYAIIIIVLFVAAILVFAPITYILLKNKEYRSKCELIKKRFNNLVIEDFIKKNIPIEHIGFNNPKYESISNLFNMFATRFDIVIETIKNNIFKLISASKNYDWHNFNILYKEINDDIDNLENSIVTLNDLYDDVLQYRNYVSYLLVAYRENTKTIISFYEKNLGNIFDDGIIHKLITNLRVHSESLNKFIDNIDNDEFVIEMKNYNFDFTQTFDLLSNWYVWTKEYNYIKHTVDEIESVLKNNSKNLSYDNIQYADKTLALINKGINVLDKKINKHDFNKIEVNINQIVKNILKMKNKLQMNFKSNEFLTKNSDFIINSFKTFIDEYKNLLSFLNQIYANFYSSNSIKNEVNDLKYRLEYIYKNCSSFINKNNAVKYNSSELFIESKNNIEDIIEWHDKFNHLIKDISNKYVYFKKIVTEITSGKLLLAQMLAFINSNEFVSSKILLNDIHKYFHELNAIELNFFSNYDQDFEYNYNSLLTIKHGIHETNLVISSIYYTKVYVEKLINYANILMINKNIELDLNGVYDLYQKGEYRDSLKFIIKLLKPYKYSHLKKQSSLSV
ncbi:hypothetical protein [Malacoplasma muris]|uniref:hypothetical protein n=1 Tax=Malacoplasma muris TaxID=2119 RepID=UPI00398ED2A3